MMALISETDPTETGEPETEPHEPTPTRLRFVHAEPIGVERERWLAALLAIAEHGGPCGALAVRALERR